MVQIPRRYLATVQTLTMSKLGQIAIGSRGRCTCNDVSVLRQLRVGPTRRQHNSEQDKHANGSKNQTMGTQSNTPGAYTSQTLLVGRCERSYHAWAAARESREVEWLQWT